MASKSGVKYNEIDSQKTASARDELVQKEIRRVGVPCLTDAIVQRERGGGRIMKALDDARANGVFDPVSESFSQTPMMWKLKKIINRDGTAPKEGDIVRVLFDRKRKDASGRKMNNLEIEAARKRGVKGFELYHTYKLDKDCCFECGYADAAQLLTQAGVHYENGLAINNYKEKSGKTHNWLYVEIVEGFNEPKSEVQNAVTNKR